MLLIDNFLGVDLSATLEFGKRMTLSKHGALGYAAQYSATMEDAAGKVNSSSKPACGCLNCVAKPTKVVVTFTSPPVFPTAGPDFYGSGVSGQRRDHLPYSCTCQSRNARSMIQIACRGDLSSQDILPNCAVYTGAPINCLTWPRKALDGMLPFFDPKLADLAQQELTQAMTQVTETNTMAGKVREILNDHLAEMPTVEDVANMLFMSAATLNRKLKAEERSFQQIKDELRYGKAQRLLKDTTLSVDQIADQLGYSDASNFAKAFKNWSGASPSQYRQGSTG